MEWDGGEKEMKNRAFCQEKFNINGVYDHHGIQT